MSFTSRPGGAGAAPVASGDGDDHPSAARRQGRELLRTWQLRRRRSQLDLASEAGVSTRHLSFVETGRARPSASCSCTSRRLDIPLRERSALLLAAGYAPVYGHRPLDGTAMAPVRAALDVVLRGHEPFRGRRRPALGPRGRQRRRPRRAGGGVDYAARPAGQRPAGQPPTPTGSLPASPTSTSGRPTSSPGCGEVDLYGDPALIALLEAVRLPGRGRRPPPEDPASRLFVRLELRTETGALRFFSTVATFGTARDVTVEELAIESFFPADRATEEALRSAAGDGGGQSSESWVASS